jgi:hypothetical protein
LARITIQKVFNNCPYKKQVAPLYWVVPKYKLESVSDNLGGANFNQSISLSRQRTI